MNQRLGDVKEFAKDLAAEGKRGNRKDRVYSSLETVGLIYLLGGLVVFVMYFLLERWKPWKVVSLILCI